MILISAILCCSNKDCIKGELRSRYRRRFSSRQLLAVYRVCQSFLQASVSADIDILPAHNDCDYLAQCFCLLFNGRNRHLVMGKNRPYVCDLLDMQDFSFMFYVLSNQVEILSQPRNGGNGRCCRRP